MIKILVVDDEQPVLDGVQFLIKKFRPDLEICGTARTGREAIEKAKILRPDILLIDIKMPGITGLEALRDIRKDLPKVITLVFSAYERFEVAQEAFELGVQDYLLKPLVKEKFLTALDRAVERWDELRQTLDWGLSLKEKWDSCLPFLEQSLIHWSQNPDGLPDEGENLRILLGITASHGQFLIFEHNSLQDPEARLGSSELKSKLSFKCDLIFGPLRSNRFHGILKCNPERESESPSIPPTIRSVLQQFPDWTVSCGGPKPWSGLYQSYCEALDMGADSETQVSKLEIEKEKRLVNSLINQNVDQLSAGLLDLGSSSNFKEIFIFILHEAAIQGWTVPNFDSYRPVFDGPQPWGEKLKVLALAPLSWAPPKNLGTAKEASVTLQKALNFINGNFHSPLSLDDAAQAAGIHPQYLSRLFSMERGESFVEYLTRLRIQKAKDLLCAGGSVKEVCYSLGYGDPNYFSRVFKKAVGKTPVEFTLSNKRSTQ